MPLIDNYRATNISRAFILNSIIIAGISILTVEIDMYIKEFYFNNNIIIRILISFSIALFSALLFYWFMFIFVGFGGGMLAPKIPVQNPFEHV